MCPVCGKICKSAFGLVGHLKLKQDAAHIQYNNRIIGNVTNTPVPQPVQEPVPQPVQQQQQQPVLQQQQQQQPVQQPPTLVEQFLDKEKQKIVDLKAERELLELMKKQMNGSVGHDHDLIDRAPESIQRELQDYYISQLGK